MPGGMSFFCIGNEPKSGLARDLGDCLQSRNVPFGTSGDCIKKTTRYSRGSVKALAVYSEIKTPTVYNKNVTCQLRK